MADFEYDVEFGQDMEFQEVCAAFMKARRDLSCFNPRRSYMGTGALEGSNPYGKDGKRMLCL
eukprot:5799879-Heterocapsa_arctica.AAC.1